MQDGIFIGICVGSGVLFILIIVIGFKCARKRQKKPPIEFPSPSAQLLADAETQDYEHSQAAAGQWYDSNSGRRYSQINSQDGLHDHMSGNNHIRETYPSYNNDQPPKFSRLTIKSSNFADRSRSEIRPNSESTFHGWYKTKQPSATKVNGGSFSHISDEIFPNRQVSAASIDKLVLHATPSSQCTHPRSGDDMLFRRMSPPHQAQSMQRSKSVNDRLISATPENRRRRSSIYRHGVKSNPNIPPHNIQKSIAGINGHYQPRLNYSSTSQNTPSSVLSTRQHSVKEIVKNIRSKLNNNLTQVGQNMRIDSHCYSLDNPNLTISLTETPGVHDADLERHYEDSPTMSQYRSNECVQCASKLSHQTMPLHKNSSILRQQSSGVVQYNTVHSSPSMSQSQRNTHLTPPSPDLLNTPPPLPSPPKYPCLKPRPPVWTLKSPPCQDFPVLSPAQSPPTPSTPPPLVSPIYIPSPTGRSVFKPILMQTVVIPSVPVTSTPVSPRKPTAKPVLLQPSPPPPSPNNLHTLQKPSAKPVLHSSPQPFKPTPAAKPSPAKPAAKPVLLASLPPRLEHPDPLTPPSSPNKPVAKPVLLQSPQTPSASPVKNTRLSKYDRQSSRQMTLGGSFLPSTPPSLPIPPLSPPNPGLSPDKPVGEPVEAQDQYLPPPPPVLPTEYESSMAPQPSSPTKPFAKPVLVSQQSPPPPAIPRLKYKTKIQVSPGTHEATDLPITHKTVINISPRRHITVYERAKVFSQRINTPENSSASPSSFTFPPRSNIHVHEENPFYCSPIVVDDHPSRQRNVQITSPNQECYTRTDKETPSPCTENEIVNIVQDVNSTVSNEELSPWKNTSNDAREPVENSESSNFTPRQTSTPNASVTGPREERTDESLIKSRLRQRRQKMAGSDSMLVDSDLQGNPLSISSSSNCITEDK